MQQMFEQCMNMMGGMMGGGMMGSMLWPLLGGTLLFIALAVGGGAVLLRALQNRTNTVRQHPLAILQERFARDELDPEEYQHRLSVLQGSR
jgi:uncharacterized membrane protein